MFYNIEEQKKRFAVWKQTNEWSVFRYDIINYLIKKNGYKTYLEIGVRDGECFKMIEALSKDSVDPVKGRG